MKRLFVVLALVAVLALLAACAPAPAPTAVPPVAPTTAPAPAATKAPAPAATTAPAAGKVPVGIVLPTKDEPRWIQDQTRFQDALKAAGYDVQILFSQGDSAKEKANVESLIAQGIKVLILCPQDASAAGAAVEEARAAGVKVISYDRLIRDTAAVDYYVTFDSISVGKAQGQYLIDKATGKGNPLYLYAGAASDNNAFLFFDGAWAVLQPKIADGTFVIKNSSQAVGLQSKATLTRDEDGKIIGQVTTNWDFAVAKKLAQDNLTAAPAADKGNVFILAPNDGTARSIADTFGADKDVKSYVVTGQDAEKPSVQYIIDGKQSMTVLKDVRVLVNDAIAAAVAYLKGQTPPQTTTYNNGKVDVPAKPSAVVTVDKNNVKAAVIDSGYYQATDFTGLTAAAAPSMDALVAAAKKEGQVTTIALPHDWCGYGDVISGFKAKYGLTVNELNPDAGSGDEVQAIIANKGNTGPQAPDVIDVGLSFGPQAKSQSLIAPYKVSTWSTIPDSAKDADGYWYGDYYGVLAFEVNTDLVKTAPQDWADLLKADYKNAVALAGDPRVSNQAIQAVYAAGLSAGAKTAADAGTAGLSFFAQLNKAGNFVPTIGKAASLAQGATPIVIRWDYNALADKDTLKGNPNVSVIVPKSGVVAGVYVQAISAYAPHPNAAKLWMEYLYSDEGQIGWLKGYCHPIRFNDLAKNNKLPADLMAKLPPAAAYAQAVFPSLDDQGAANAVITKQWDTVVGANVK